MIQNINIYKKVYSEIINIQNKEIVYYNLITTLSDKLTYYGIEIILESENDSPERTCFEGLSESKSFVLDIIKFLYENSIKPCSSLAIISDLISAEEYCSYK